MRVNLEYLKGADIGMKKIVCDSYEEICRFAADIFAQTLREKPDSVLGFATGSTPIGLYDELVKRYENGDIDFSKAQSFNLDEYYPIDPAHPQSYNSFMQKYLFSKINLSKSQLLDGSAADPVAECARYDAEIEASGGVDLQLLGIGVNGHIAFIEPAQSYPLGTSLIELAEDTLVANSRFFEDGEAQPTTALSVGLNAIFKTKRIMMLVTGAGKADVIKKLFEQTIHTDMPASLLHLHPDVTVIVDKAANGE